jgi:hypothetical protein
MNKSIVIIRLDPLHQTITKLRKEFGRNAMPAVRQVLRAKTSDKIGWHRLIDIDEKRLFKPDGSDGGPTSLVAAGFLNVQREQRRWQFRGCDDHAGVGFLFGQGIGGGMVDCPVDLEWVNSRIQWLEGESHAELELRAGDTFDLMPPEIVSALANVVISGEEYWIRADHEHLKDAFIRLDIASEATGGRRLTKMGKRVHEMVVAAQPRESEVER